MRSEYVKRAAARGAIWVFAFGLIGFPLLYVRNWFLGRIEPTGEVVGVFALIILIRGGISALLFFGGKNVLTTFYPRLKSNIQRNGFLNSYYISVAAAAVLGIAVLLLWPEAIEWLIRRKLHQGAKWLLIFLIPTTLLSYLGNSVLTGMQRFGLAAFLERLQLFTITILACLFYFLARELLADNPLVILGGTVVAVSLFSTFISLMKVHKRIGFSKALWLPPNGARFACFSYLEKMASFGYLAIDQIFVVQKFDISRLGVYFLLLQVARIIPLTIQIFGHIILTTFSALLGSGHEQQVVSAYRKLSRLSVWLNFTLSLFLILFARFIAGIFGPTYAKSYRYLIWLAVNMNLWSLYTVTSMCATSYEKMKEVFYTKVSQVSLQLIATLALIGSLGIYGVIAGKVLGTIAGSIGLFIVLALCRPQNRIYPPIVYMISQLCIIPVAIYAHFYTINYLMATVLFVLALFIFVTLGKYRLQEFITVVNLIRSKTAR